MMKKINLLFILTLLVFVQSGFANIISVNIVGEVEETSEVKGVLVTNDEIKFIDRVNFTKNDDGVTVSFSVDEKQGDTLVGAYIKNQNGEKIYSTLKPVSEFFKEEKPLNICAPKKADVTLLAGQESALRELISTRKKRQDLLNKEIDKLLSFEMLYVLNNLEKYFGLTYDKPLSKELDKNELLARLAYLKIAVKNLDVNKLSRVRIENKD